MSVAKSVQDVDERDRRAASEAMVVVPNGPGLYEVHSGETNTYVVDIVGGACECADSRYRDAHCKHARRVEMAIGEREIPAGVRVDPTLRLRRGGN
ncbi:hypothetical protein HALLA_12215 [Halostagnicola larsenii XH-48]|uniref:SWIM-type domain-containing protein n=1 Tax=Halostagnicola larsenii XH-48 TaxID=797299 RepID=W0JR44_9EURY|nr:hypothetical protein [Halostagnicola larsenii]AHF99431.1 hypothetical protein HALLA_11900 [Halostagnicola larsenii XH-48]AHF99442.1 hypothetical protein HALLA_12215 [Halostagnicola larsenii XH-48]